MQISTMADSDYATFTSEIELRITLFLLLVSRIASRVTGIPSGPRGHEGENSCFKI